MKSGLSFSCLEVFRSAENVFSFFDVLVSLLYFLLSRLFDFLLHKGKESLETTREEQRKKLQGFTMLAIKNKNKKA